MAGDGAGRPAQSSVEAVRHSDDALVAGVAAPSKQAVSSTVEEEAMAGTTSQLGSSLRPISTDRLMQPTAESASSVAPLATYSQFLELLKQPSAEAAVKEVREFIGEFPANLTRPQAARRIHSFLSDICQQLLAVRTFVNALGGTMEEAQDATLDHLEKFVVLKLYKLLFRHAAADVREDERVGRCLRDVSASMQMPTLSKEHGESFAQAVEELRKVDQYKAPRDKAFVMLRVYRTIESLLAEDVFLARANVYDGDERGDGCEQVSALSAALELAIVEASPQNLFSNIEFTRAFHHPSRVSAEERDCVSHFSQALATVAGVANSRMGAGVAGGSSGSLFQEASGSAIAWATSPMHQAETSSAWLADAGVTFQFEGRSAEDLLVGEVDVLLEEYHRMAQALRELVGIQATGSPR